MRSRDTSIPIKRKIPKGRLEDIKGALLTIASEVGTGEPLSSSMAKDILGIIEAQSWLLEQLHKVGVTIAILRKVFGIDFKKNFSKESRKSNDNSDKEGSNEDCSLQGGDKGCQDEPHDSGKNPPNQEAEASPEGNKEDPLRAGKNNNSTHPGKRRAEDFPGAEIIRHSHESLTPGEPCPANDCKGKVYPFRKEEESREIVIIEAQPLLRAERHRFEDLRCNLCGAMYHAHMDSCLLANGKEDGRGLKFTRTARAMIAFQHVWSGIPYNRLSQVQGMFGLALSPSLLYEQIALVADEFTPFIEFLCSTVCDSYRVYTDDFNITIRYEGPVLRESRKNGKMTYREGTYTSVVIAVLQSGHAIPIFSSGLKHAGENLDNLFEDRSPELPAPTVISDASKVNKTFSVEAQVAGCLQHARERFVDAVSYDEERAKQILDLFKIAFNVDRGTHDFTPKARLAILQEKALPSLEQAKILCQDWMEGKVTSPNGPLGKACQYYITYFKQITLCCVIAGIALTNNISEWSFFLANRRRNNSYFFNTFRGAHTFDKILTILMLAAMNHRNPWQYLHYLYTNAHKIKGNWHQFLPWKISEDKVASYKGTCEDYWIPTPPEIEPLPAESAKTP